MSDASTWEKIKPSIDEFNRVINALDTLNRASRSLNDNIELKNQPTKWYQTAYWQKTFDRAWASEQKNKNKISQAFKEILPRDENKDVSPTRSKQLMQYLLATQTFYASHDVIIQGNQNVTKHDKLISDMAAALKAYHLARASAIYDHVKQAVRTTVDSNGTNLLPNSTIRLIKKIDQRNNPATIRRNTPIAKLLARKKIEAHERTQVLESMNKVFEQQVGMTDHPGFNFKSTRRLSPLIRQNLHIADSRMKKVTKTASRIAESFYTAAEKNSEEAPKNFRNPLAMLGDMFQAIADAARRLNGLFASMTGFYSKKSDDLADEFAQHLNLNGNLTDKFVESISCIFNCEAIRENRSLEAAVAEAKTPSKTPITNQKKQLLLAQKSAQIRKERQARTNKMRREIRGRNNLR